MELKPNSEREAIGTMTETKRQTIFPLPSPKCNKPVGWVSPSSKNSSESENYALGDENPSKDKQCSIKNYSKNCYKKPHTHKSKVHPSVHCKRKKWLLNYQPDKLESIDEFNANEDDDSGEVSLTSSLSDDVFHPQMDNEESYKLLMKEHIELEQAFNTLHGNFLLQSLVKKNDSSHIYADASRMLQNRVHVLEKELSRMKNAFKEKCDEAETWEFRVLELEQELSEQLEKEADLSTTDSDYFTDSLTNQQYRDSDRKQKVQFIPNLTVVAFSGSPSSSNA